MRKKDNGFSDLEDGFYKTMLKQFFSFYQWRRKSVIEGLNYAYHAPKENYHSCFSMRSHFWLQKGKHELNDEPNR